MGDPAPARVSAGATEPAVWVPARPDGGLRADVALDPGIWCLQTYSHVEAALVGVHVLQAGSSPSATTDLAHRATHLETAALEQRVPGSIGGPDDVQYFRITPHEQGWLHVSSEGGAHVTGRLAAFVTGPESGIGSWRVLSRSTSVGPGKDGFMLSAPVVSGRPYFLAVLGEGTAAAGAYELIVALEQGRPRGESPETAVPLEIGSMTREWMGTLDEERFFRIAADSATHVRVRPHSGDAEGRYGLRLTEWRDRPAEDDSDLAGPGSPALVVGVPSDAAIQPAGDSDYFALRVAEAGDYVVSTVGDEVDTVGALFAYGASETLFSDDDSGGGANFAIHRHIEQGDYVVRVGALHRKTGTYAVQAQRFEDDHAASRERATPIAPGESVKGRIDAAHDVDYFKIRPPATAAEGSHLVAYTEGGVDTAGALAGDDGKTLAASDDEGEGLNFRLEWTSGASAAFLRIEGAGGDEGPYTLVVESPHD